MIRTRLLVAPAAEPVSLAEAKAHLRLDAADDDGLVASLIEAARTVVETEVRRALIHQTWQLIVDQRPADGSIISPVVPLASVVEVRSVGADGTGTIVDPVDYAVEPDRNAIVLSEGGATGAAGIEADVVAGYGADGSAVPAPLRQAILLLVAEWYEHRGALAATTAGGPGASGWRGLVAPWRRAGLA